MKTSFNLDLIAPARDRLARHPVYESVRSIDDLRVFMQHHVYSVWDFMSLCKTLQNELAPTSVPWAPKGDPMVRRFINEIVLEEETDQGLPGHEPEFLSHYELYRTAMREIGADADTVQALSKRLPTKVSARRLRIMRSPPRRAPSPPRLFSSSKPTSLTSSPPRSRWGANTSSPQCFVRSYRTWRSAKQMRQRSTITSNATFTWMKIFTPPCPCGCWTLSSTAMPKKPARPRTPPFWRLTHVRGFGTACSKPCREIGKPPPNNPPPSGSSPPLLCAHQNRILHTSRIGAS